MAVRKTFRGDGALLIKDREIPISYVIEGYRDANIRRADGLADGVDIKDVIDIQSTNDVRLRTADGKIVDIAFLGRDAFGPQRFGVNTPLDF